MRGLGPAPPIHSFFSLAGLMTFSWLSILLHLTVKYLCIRNARVEEKKIMDLENRLVAVKGRGREWDGLGIWG